MVRKLQSPLVPLMAIRGITQQDIADALGVTQKTVSNWMTGKTPARLTIREWYKFAELLGTTIDKLPKDLGPQPIHDTQQPATDGAQE